MRPLLALLLLLTFVGCRAVRPKRAGDEEAGHPRIRVIETLNCNEMVRYISPMYPKEARQKHIEGTVRLRARITKQGSLEDIMVLKGDPIFVPEALRVAKQWLYSPCLVDSQPVEVINTFDINFNLSQ